MQVDPSNRDDRGPRLHPVDHDRGSVLYDVQRVKLYECSPEERVLVEQIDRPLDSGEATERLARLERLSDRMASACAACPAATPGFTTLWLNLTHACNLDCAYCYATEGAFETGSRSMTPETARSAVDLLFELTPGSPAYVLVLAGREPLLNMRALRAAVEHARANKPPGSQVLFRILTNGTVLSDRILQFLLEHPVSLQISVDGPKRVHDANRPDKAGNGTYERIHRNIERLRASGFTDFTVRGTVCRGGPSPEELIEGLAEDGFAEVALQPVMCGPGSPLKLTPDQVSELGDWYERKALQAAATGDESALPPLVRAVVDRLGDGERKTRYCGVGRTLLVVTPDGALYPCPSLVSETSLQCGDLSEGLDREALVRFDDNTVDLKPACRSCWARNLCGGGCIANAWEVNGDLRVPDDDECAVTKARIRAAILYADRRSSRWADAK